MSNRPTRLLKDGTLHWVLPTYNSSGVLVDADSTPTVAVRKNGASTGDSVTITKRSATTGIYDCSYNPASEVEGDSFQIEETATISSQAYFNSFCVKVFSAERGTDSALLASDKPTNFDLLAINGSGEVTPDSTGGGGGGGSTHSAQDVADLILQNPSNLLVTNSSGEVTTSNPASGGGSAHTAADVAALILVTPANKLATDSSGNVEANNMRGTDSANTVAPDNASISAILADTNELQTNQGDWATATGFSTHSASNVVTAMQAVSGDFKADVSALASQSSVDSIDTDVQSIGSDVTTILADTNELQTNQGNWLTATGFSTHAASDVVTALQAVSGDFKADVSALATQSSVDVIDGIVDNILVDTNDLQTNQGAWLTATGFSTHSAADVVTAMQAVSGDFKADVSALATQASVNVIDGIVDAILVDTADLQANQGSWLTATGFSTHSAADVVTAMQVVSGDFKADVSALATQASVNTIDGIVDAILVDTADLQANQGNWLTATGFSTFDASTDTVTTDTASRDASKADVSGLLTASSYTSSLPTNFADLAVEVTSGKVTTSNPAAGSGSAHTAADVAALILSTPANKLATDSSGNVEANNMRGTDGANTVAPVDVSANVAAILADTNELQQNQGDWATATGFSTHGASDVVTAMQAVAGDFKADVSALASQASVDTIDGIVDSILVDTADLQANQGDWLTATGFSTFDPTTDTVARVTLVDTTTDVTNQSSGGATAAEVVTAMQAVSGDFKADVSALATQSSVNTIDGIVDAILLDTADLQANQGDWLTATGFSTFDPATDAVTTDAASRNASKADVSGLLTSSSYTSSLPTNFADLAVEVTTGKVTTANPAAGSGSSHTAADVAALILSTPANKLATDSSGNVEANNMRGTDGANTVAPVDVSSSVAAILADTDELQQNQGDWLTATGFSTFDASTDVVTTDTASRDASKANVSGLLTSSVYNASLPANFVDLNITNTTGKVTTANPASGSGSAHTPADVVLAMQAVAGDFKADVSTLASQTSVDVIDGIVDSILADTADLQANQGDWATATGFSTHSVADVVSAMQLVAANFKADVSGLATQASVNTIDANVDSILVDTNELQANQGDWATATGFSTHSAANVVTAMQAVANDFKANVSSLATQSSLNVIDGNVDSILADTSELQANQGDWATATGFSTHSPSNVVSSMQAVAGDFKADTSNLATQASVNVIDGNVDSILADTSDLQANQGDWATADTSLLARESSVSDVKAVTDKLDTTLSLDGAVYQFTANSLENVPSGSDASAIYQYFTDAARADLFKADVSDVIRKGVSLRYTNNGTGAGFDEVTITDAP